MSDPKNSFESADAQKPAGLVSELVAMLRKNKKYWLIPIIVTLFLFGILIVLGGSSAAPFIYTLF